MTSEPLVSVCVPTYNGGRFIDAALDSIASQDYENLEVIVVDDGSTDDTAQRVRRWRDPRLRLFVASRNRGHNRAWNETVFRAGGTYLKFLHQDDRLRSDCVSRMVDLFGRAPTLGIVFSRRALDIEDLEPEAAAAFRVRNGRLDASIEGLTEINSGPEILRRWFHQGYSRNWIGEPSAVMVRRACLERVGGFAHHIAQATDIEMWMRILAHFDAGFISDELATFHVGASSLSTRNRVGNAAWLDRLWTLECLAHDRAAAAALPDLGGALRRERGQTLRAALRLGHLGDGTRVPVATYRHYLRFRAGVRAAPFPFPASSR